MKILHLMLACYYIDNNYYQENILPKQNKLDGHTVKIIASTTIYPNNLHLGFSKPGSYINENGIPVIRLPYIKIINPYISSKLRIYPNVYKHIKDFSPDIICCHGLMTYELKTIIRYISDYPNVKLFLDSHTDFHNSARGFLSRNILHGLYYKNIVKNLLPKIKKIYCVTYECMIFLNIVYKIPFELLILFPLGGIVEEESIREQNRAKIRKSLNLHNEDILIIHAGKMTKEKRSEDLLKAFMNVQKKNLRLILIGSMDEETSMSANKYLNRDLRISYLGWMNNELLIEYLCAADLYIQPGSQSVTMQIALCNNCAAALYPHESHKFLLGDRVFYVESIKDMELLFENISNNRNILEEKRKKSFEFAQLALDYKGLARVMYE
jgi:glycosyltransferase involved in cell wall biosynthesis